jgi:hypothetical protein
MAWLTPTDAESAVLIGTRIDVVGIDVDVSDAAGHHEAAA